MLHCIDQAQDDEDDVTKDVASIVSSGSVGGKRKPRKFHSDSSVRFVLEPVVIKTVELVDPDPALAAPALDPIGPRETLDIQEPDVCVSVVDTALTLSVRPSHVDRATSASPAIASAVARVAVHAVPPDDAAGACVPWVSVVASVHCFALYLNVSTMDNS